MANPTLAILIGRLWPILTWAKKIDRLWPSLFDRLWPNRLGPKLVFQSFGLLFQKKEQQDEKKAQRTEGGAHPKGWLWSTLASSALAKSTLAKSTLPYKKPLNDGACAAIAMHEMSDVCQNGRNTWALATQLRASGRLARARLCFELSSSRPGMRFLRNFVNTKITKTNLSHRENECV